jgi:hypothetical protein
MPLLEWVDRNARHSTITARWFTLRFRCRPWVNMKTHAEAAAEQLQALVERIRRLRSS